MSSRDRALAFLLGYLADKPCLTFSFQDYLHKMNVIHRDLKSKNCLARNDEVKQSKISQHLNIYYKDLFLPFGRGCRNHVKVVDLIEC